MLERLLRSRRRVFNWLVAQTAVSTAAGLLTIPVLAFAFGHYAWWSLPANLLLVPLVGVLLPLYYAGLAVAWLSGWSFALWPAWWGLSLFALLSDSLAALRALMPETSLLWPPLFLNFALLALLVCERRRPREESPPAGRRLAVWIGIALLGPAGSLLWTGFTRL